MVGEFSKTNNKNYKHFWGVLVTTENLVILTLKIIASYDNNR